jgi:hypothetical protein
MRDHTTTSGVSIVNLPDILTSLNEMQSAIVELETVINTIDTSPTSSFGKRISILERNLANALTNLNTFEADLLALNAKVEALSNTQPITPVVPVPEPQPSF